MSRTELEDHCQFTPVRPWVHEGLRASQFILGTAEWIFLKFCMKLEITKSKISTEPDF